MMGSAPSRCSAMAAMMRVLISVRVAPLRPPSAEARGCPSTASREIVVLVAMIPSSPEETMTSTAVRSWSGSRSGASLTSTGTRLPLASASSACLAASRPSRAPRNDRLLELTQPGRVRRRDVDGEVIGERREDLHELLVVIGGPLQRRGLLLADVDPEHQTRFARPAKLIRDIGRAATRKTHPVDHRSSIHQPEDPRLRVARLRQRRHRPDLDMTETEGGETPPTLAVLVVAGGETDPVGKLSPKASTGSASGTQNSLASAARTGDTAPALAMAARDRACAVSGSSLKRAARESGYSIVGGAIEPQPITRVTSTRDRDRARDGCLARHCSPRTAACLASPPIALNEAR